MENTYIIKFYDLSEEDYENGAYLNGFVGAETIELEEGFPLIDYYHDCIYWETNPNIEKIDDDRFSYETAYGEKRYVVIA